MPAISVFIADGQQIIRDKLHQLIALQPDMVFMGEARSSEETLVKVRAFHPQILLLDMALPQRGGLLALDLISAAAVETRVIVLSLHHDIVYIQATYRAGALSYLVKTGPAEKLLKTIRLTARCERRKYCSWPPLQAQSDRRLHAVSDAGHN